MTPRPNSKVPVTCMDCGVVAPARDTLTLNRLRWGYVVSPVEGWACPKEFPAHPDEVRYDQTMAMMDVLAHSPELAPTVLDVLRPSSSPASL